jgi:hypothetical protein
VSHLQRPSNGACSRYHSAPNLLAQRVEIPAHAPTATSMGNGTIWRSRDVQPRASCQSRHGFVDSQINTLPTRHQTRSGILLVSIDISNRHRRPTKISSLNLPIVPIRKKNRHPARKMLRPLCSSATEVAPCSARRHQTRFRRRGATHHCNCGMIPLQDRQVISRRGSTRQFSRSRSRCRSFYPEARYSRHSADFLDPIGSPQRSLLIEPCDGLAPGSYVYHWEEKF